MSFSEFYDTLNEFITLLVMSGLIDENVDEEVVKLL